MIQIEFGSHFLHSTKRLPLAQKKKLSSLLEVLQIQPYHSTLHTKALSGELSGLYSFRITRDWRVIFRFADPLRVVLIDVGHRRDIYR